MNSMMLKFFTKHNNNIVDHILFITASQHIFDSGEIKLEKTERVQS